MFASILYYRMGLVLHEHHHHGHHGSLSHESGHDSGNINSHSIPACSNVLPNPDLLSDQQVVALANDRVNEARNCSSTHHRHEMKQSNINVRAAFIHVIGDLLQSIGVLIAAFIIYYKVDKAITKKQF
jgi:Co/Zn/Cd efflux system component